MVNQDHELPKEEKLDSRLVPDFQQENVDHVHLRVINEANDYTAGANGPFAATKSSKNERITF